MKRVKRFLKNRKTRRICWYKCYTTHLCVFNHTICKTKMFFHPRKANFTHTHTHDGWWSKYLFSFSLLVFLLFIGILVVKKELIPIETEEWQKKNPQVSYPFFVPLRCARRHTEITERKGHILSIYLSLSNSQFHKTIGHHRVSCEEKSFLCLYKQTNKKKLHCKTNKIRKKSQIKSCLNSKSLFYQFIHIA